MPEAGIKTSPLHIDLETCEGGYVELRQLSYDELLERRDGAMKVTQQMGIKDAAATISFANRWSALYTFPRCIVEHNLTFDGQPIDFSKPQQAFAQLDPKIGAEIERHIDKLNEEDQSLEDFTTALLSSSTNESDLPSKSTDEPS
jgi:hypothetical protein